MKVPYASIAVVALIVMTGCSRSPVVPVSGKVIFPDREIPEVCRLTFVPSVVPEDVGGGESGVRPGGATMEPDGTYRLSPFKGVEGLLPGTYKVRVSYFDLKKNGNPDREGDWRETSFEAEELVVEAGSRAVEHDITVK